MNVMSASSMRQTIMMSGSSTGRKELIHELRETSLMGGNAAARGNMIDKAVQFRGNMDLGSGDTTDFYFGSGNDSLRDGFQFNLHVHQPNESPTTIIKTTFVESSASQMPPSPSTPQPPPSPSTQPLTKLIYSSSSESLNKWQGGNDKTDSDHSFKGKENKSTETKNSTLVVVEEEGKQPKLRVNESNPTVPSHKEPSKTSTLRLSDRQRSESEDDIEKADDLEQDGAVFDHKTLRESCKVIVEDSTRNSEKMDKNGNKSDQEQNEQENDCVVQCLYYTIQCCECITF